MMTRATGWTWDYNQSPNRTDTSGSVGEQVVPTDVEWREVTRETTMTVVGET